MEKVHLEVSKSPKTLLYQACRMPTPVYKGGQVSLVKLPAHTLQVHLVRQNSNL